MVIFNSYVKLPEGNLHVISQLYPVIKPVLNVQFIQFIRAALGSHTAWESLAPGWLWERWRLAPGDGCNPRTPKNPIGWILRMDILNDKQITIKIIFWISMVIE